MTDLNSAIESIEAIEIDSTEIESPELLESLLNEECPEMNEAEESESPEAIEFEGEKVFLPFEKGLNKSQSNILKGLIFGIPQANLSEELGIPQKGIDSGIEFLKEKEIFHDLNSLLEMKEELIEIKSNPEKKSGKAKKESLPELGEINWGDYENLLKMGYKSCAILRGIARNWESPRKEFLEAGIELGLNKGTLSRQYQEGRKS